MKLYDLDEKKSFEIENEITVPKDIKNFSKEIDDIFLPSKVRFQISNFLSHAKRITKQTKICTSYGFYTMEKLLVSVNHLELLQIANNVLKFSKS